MGKELNLTEHYKIQYLFRQDIKYSHDKMFDPRNRTNTELNFRQLLILNGLRSYLEEKNTKLGSLTLEILISIIKVMNSATDLFSNLDFV